MSRRHLHDRYLTGFRPRVGVEPGANIPSLDIRLSASRKKTAISCRACLGLQRLPAMPILRAICASPDRARSSGSVHAADSARAPPRDDSRVLAPSARVFGACRTLFDGVSNAGQRHVGFLTLHLARGGHDGRKLQSAHTLSKHGAFVGFVGYPPPRPAHHYELEE